MRLFYFPNETAYVLALSWLDECNCIQLTYHIIQPVSPILLVRYLNSRIVRQMASHHFPPRTIELVTFVS